MIVVSHPFLLILPCFHYPYFTKSGKLRVPCRPGQEASRAWADAELGMRGASWVHQFMAWPMTKHGQLVTNGWLVDLMNYRLMTVVYHDTVRENYWLDHER